MGCNSKVKVSGFRHLSGGGGGSKRSLSLRTHLHNMQDGGKTDSLIAKRNLPDLGG